MKTKKGDISMTITLIMSLAFLMILTVYIVNIITPFIWYQKLQNISNKYIYIIERFGYLTDYESKELFEDLEKEGFDTSKIIATYPKERLNYGTIFKFEIKYDLYQKYNIILNGIKSETRIVPLHIKKYSYSKI